ncbi:hypothetical protein ACRRTK_012855 [Alexandromys fortis]
MPLSAGGLEPKTRDLLEEAFGTRIIYDRKFLMECRNSPVAKTPPKDLPAIPGVTSPTSDEPPMQVSQSHLHSPEEKRAGGEESQFEMDI